MPMGIGLGIGVTRFSGVGGFSPASLFAAGEPGVWYDPSDFSTMFQDSAGITPVTAVEQPVGLLLDKSQGLVLGPELVTNGNFSDGTTGWTASGATLSVTNGVLRITNDAAAAGYAYTTITTVVGDTYAITVNALGGTGGSSLRVGTSANSVANLNVTPSGIKTYYFAATATTTYVTLRTGSATAGLYTEWDDASVRELPGNHATQATSASRPVLSARVNLLTKTEQFNDAAWTKNNATISANAAAAPDGTTTADRLTGSGVLAVQRVTQNPLVTGSHTFTVYAKANTNNFMQLLQGNDVTFFANFDLSTGSVGTKGAGTTSSIQDVGGGWYRCSATWTIASAAAHMVYLADSASVAYGAQSATTNSIYIWGADLRVTNDGVNLPVYQRVNTSTDYDTTGFPYYLSFDGSDDSMVTNTITPGIDKAQVFAGVRKLSDAVGTIVETGLSFTSIGAFFLVNGDSPSSNFIYAGRGARVGLIGDSAIAAVTSPTTAVITAQQDINGGTPTTIRRNGSLAGSSVNTTFGGGNFLAYPLYIGRRAGTSAPFNGRIYSLITRFGANLDVVTINNTETWVNGKTKAY